MTRALLRPVGFDDLGVRRALSSRLLPSLVAAMTFLAALALAGAVGAAGLADRWQQGAGRAVTIQVPDPGEAAASGPGTRLDRVRAALDHAPGLSGVRVLEDADVRGLLRPWLGVGAGQIAIPLPAVIDARTDGETGADGAGLQALIEAAAPGSLIEEHDQWVRRLAILARSLQACAGLALAVVGFVAVAVVAVATRAGLSARRDAIDTVHGLGATDGYVAGRFARRAMVLAAAGAAIGSGASLPVLLGLTYLAAPFSGSAPEGLGAAVAAMPVVLWLFLPLLPVLAAAIGWTTTHWTVRLWLRRLP